MAPSGGKGGTAGAELRLPPARLSPMTMSTELLTAASLFVLVGGRVCGGIQWHLWQRRLEEQRLARRMAEAGR